jgi:hypothetical protein
MGEQFSLEDLAGEYSGRIGEDVAKQLPGPTVTCFPEARSRQRCRRLQHPWAASGAELIPDGHARIQGVRAP